MDDDDIVVEENSSWQSGVSEIRDIWLRAVPGSSLCFGLKVGSKFREIISDTFQNGRIEAT